MSKGEPWTEWFKMDWLLIKRKVICVSMLVCKIAITHGTSMLEYL